MLVSIYLSENSLFCSGKDYCMVIYSPSILKIVIWVKKIYDQSLIILLLAKYKREMISILFSLKLKVEKS
jgi:hypothetical protein